MTEWILYGIKPNMSSTVLLHAGFICKEDAMVYWRWREQAGCRHLFLTRKRNNRTNKGHVSACNP